MYSHPRKLVDKLLKVPLMIKNGENQEIERKVSTMDIAPTKVEKYGVGLKDLVKAFIQEEKVLMLVVLETGEDFTELFEVNS